MCHHKVTRSRLKLALSPSPAVLSQPSSSTSTPECPQTFSALNSARATSQHPSNSDPSMLWKDDHVSFHLKNKQSWDTGHLISKSGKSSGKWKNSWNMSFVLASHAGSVDFTHDVAEWKYHCPSDDNDMEIIQ